MHSRATVMAALDLLQAGNSAVEVAAALGVPRRTVSDWARDKLPRSSAVDRCELCLGVHDFAALPTEYAYLLGLYLGDGCLSRHPRSVYRLRITLDVAYPGIVEEASAAMIRVCGRAGRQARTDNCVEVYSFWRQWPCHIPQHGSGPKHLRPIVLANWQQAIVDRHPELVLRGLIHSDGCRAINTGRGGWSHPRYSFYNKSADIHEIFRSACERIGVRWTAAPHTTYVSRKADVALLGSFIGPKS